MNNSRSQSFIIYAILFIAIVAMVVFNFRQPPATTDNLTINQLAIDVQNGKVARIKINPDNTLAVIYKGNLTEEKAVQKEEGTPDQMPPSLTT